MEDVTIIPRPTLAFSRHKMGMFSHLIQLIKSQGEALVFTSFIESNFIVHPRQEGPRGGPGDVFGFVIGLGGDRRFYAHRLGRCEIWWSASAGGGVGVFKRCNEDLLKFQQEVVSSIPAIKLPVFMREKS